LLDDLLGGECSGMDIVDRVLRALDRAQRRWRWVAFPYAVMKKFSDDQVGHLAALMAYYAFLSVFPMLLLFVTVLGYLLQGNPGLQARLVHSALVEFPVIGTQLELDGLTGHWWVVVVSILVSLWGAKGVASATQDAFNTVWNVPFAQRPSYPASLARGFALLFLMAFTVLLTGFLAGYGSGDGILVGGGALLVSWLASVGLFIAAFRVAIAGQVTTGELLRGAVASALLWQALLVLGKFLVQHQIRHAQSLYGVFGVVLGLLAWLHLQAQVTLFAAEWDVVRARRLWPRSITAPPTTRADRRALTAYVKRARRLAAEEQDVHVRFADAPQEQETDEAPRPDPLLPT
jgi:membrane protein